LAILIVLFVRAILSNLESELDKPRTFLEKINSEKYEEIIGQGSGLGRGVRFLSTAAGHVSTL
jgi:hypothetical protein